MSRDLVNDQCLVNWSTGAWSTGDPCLDACLTCGLDNKGDLSSFKSIDTGVAKLLDQ